jgi:hypothetical protein
VSKDKLLVLAPLIPLTPVVITWWLPWEDWIPKKVPKYVVGPYLFYVGFAFWYFKFDWFFVLCAGCLGMMASVAAAMERINR